MRENGGKMMLNSLNILHSGVVGEDRDAFFWKFAKLEQLYGATSPQKVVPQQNPQLYSTSGLL